MSKFELSISPNYVPSWTFIDAVRELFQNALDQESVDPSNKASWSYDAETQTLSISNEQSVLSAQSLLLGQTTKATDHRTIGQFGEGYKIATLVLLREGKGLTIYNTGADEVWKPRLVKSRRYGTEVLTFFTEKIPRSSRTTHKPLVVKITGITPVEYECLVEKNLHLRSDYTVLEESTHGQVIDLPGQVFVNGLWVCEFKPYQMGYNFKPGSLRLDRDRKMVSDFDLRWLASMVWSKSSDESRDTVLDMIKKGCADVAYLADMLSGERWRDIAYQSFYDKYGRDAVPVTSQEGVDALSRARGENYKPIVVSEVYYNLITGSSLYAEPDLGCDTDDTDIKVQQLMQELNDWFEGAKKDLSAFDREAFIGIYTDLQEALK